mgnify:CR=1 FL=1
MPGARRAKTAAKENLSQQHTPQSQRKRHDSAGMYVASSLLLGISIISRPRLLMFTKIMILTINPLHRSNRGTTAFLSNHINPSKVLQPPCERSTASTPV